MEQNEKNKTQAAAIGCAVLAATLYALNAPVSKLLLQKADASMMAALLYLGSGLGMGLVRLTQKATGHRSAERPLERADLPFVMGMIVLDVAAPIFLMWGLQRMTAETAALLNNFEIVATSLIALLLFREKISRRLWAAIGLVTLSSMILSVEGAVRLSFSGGALLVLLACVCWGLESNCTRSISEKDPLQIVVVKGFGSGIGAFLVAVIQGQRLPGIGTGSAALALGFVAYGLSIFFYVRAQRTLGAARTSAYYALAPFIGAALALAIFRKAPGAAFWVALPVMAVGAYLAAEPAEASA